MLGGKQDGYSQPNLGTNHWGKKCVWGGGLLDEENARWEVPRDTKRHPSGVASN